jgi:hypothetical protein
MCLSHEITSIDNYMSIKPTKEGRLEVLIYSLYECHSN